MVKPGRKLNFDSRSYHQFVNAYTEAKSMSAIIIECIVTGQVFSDATYENFIGTYNAGEGLYQVFVDK